VRTKTLKLGCLAARLLKEMWKKYENEMVITSNGKLPAKKRSNWQAEVNFYKQKFWRE
jgi:hypothetical protein